jgi:peptide chain release factor subunit 1
LLKTLPANGIVVFCGCPDEEIKRVLIVVEPLKPIQQTLYLCDSKFHTEVLRDQLSTGDSKIGFVIIDGHSASFHTLVGNVKETLFKLEVQLPKKHGRGGQSQNRFARIRDEKRGWYASKVAEFFTQYFMENGLLQVSHLIFAGCANFKHDLAKKLDPRVNEKILAFLDVSYGGENGFHEAIELSLPFLKNSKYVNEQKILESFFDLIATDAAYCYLPAATIGSLEQGLVETLIVWDELPDYRIEIINVKDPLDKKVVYKPTKENEFPGYEIISSVPLLDWIFEFGKKFGAQIQLVSSSSAVGNQFIAGFGGIGGKLRFKSDHLQEFMNENGDEEEGSEESEYDYEY